MTSSTHGWGGEVFIQLVIFQPAFYQETLNMKYLQEVLTAYYHQSLKMGICCHMKWASVIFFPISIKMLSALPVNISH